MADRTIFRDTALEAYRRRTNRDVLPRLTSWPAIAFCWIMIGSLVMVAVLAWSVQVPIYVAGSGVILGRNEPSRPVGGGTTAVLFVSPGQSAGLRLGQPVQGQIGSSGEYVKGAVTIIEPDVIGPDTARNRYRISPDVITQPSRVVIVRLDETLQSTAYGGSGLGARIQVGSQPLLAFFPELGKLFGDSG